ncbi:MAG TPA: Hpt domain-containing protein [Gammaproteobacteria bacterium]
MSTEAETNDLAAHSLDLVSREIGNTLETARRELEDFAEGNAARDALDRAADLLHLAQGALKIIELNGAGMLAEEMELTCRHVRACKEQQQVDTGLEALTRAMVQLPAYLERVMSGGRDIALVLLPLLNELRQARGEPSLSEGSLLLLNAGPFERHLASKPQVAVDAESSRRFQLTARRLRPAFQSALLQWIRGHEAPQHLERLIQISGALEKAASTEAVRQLWFVLTGVLRALRGGQLEPTVNVKRLVGQADRQLKRLIDGGEAAWVESPPVELLNSLLYYVARAGSGDERLAQIRELYRLDEAVPPESQLAEARESLAGPSVKLMRTVAKAIKEDLSSVKDALDIFVRTGMEDVEQLKPQLDMLKKIGDTLGVLGLEKARAEIQREARELHALVGSRKIESPLALEKIAATLLDVEDALDRELIRAIVPGGHDPAPSESEAEAQYRHVTQAVIGECIVNLTKVKEAVTQLVETPEDGRVLEHVKPQLRGITAGLLMLNKTRAVKIVERIGAVIATRLGPGRKPLKPEYLERLADAVVAVEYYMETISRGRSDPWYMLDNASRCLDLLEALPAAKRPAPAPVAAAPPPKKAQKPPSVMEVDEERSDPELLELFIEEAKEEIASIARFLPIWAERPEDSDALISVRRSFHTLKGSGRMVGAQMIGEFAWSIENLLNRVINQTLEPTPAMIAFIQEAADVFPQLIEQLEVGIQPRADVQLLMKRAEAFAAGDPDAARLSGDALRLPAPDEADAPAGAASAAAGDDRRAAAPDMDPVLVDIFVKETLGHLETLRAFVESARRGEAPHPVDEPVYRACHTLLGSAKMAAFAPAVALAQPLSEHLGRLFQAGRGLVDDGIETLAAAADELARMTDALSSGTPFAPDPDVVARLERLEDSAAPEQPAAPEEVSSPALVPNFDPEIAAIFMEEAAEILENAESALGTLRREGEGSASVVELQRLLHTLKGGARMAGVTPMGDLSHALETLLAGMAERRVAPSAETLDLLQQCLDTLHSMRDCIDAGRPLPAAKELVGRIDALSSPGAKPAEPPPAAPAPAAAADAGAAAQDGEAVARPGEEPTVRQLAPPLDAAAGGETRADAAPAADRPELAAEAEAPAAARDGGPAEAATDGAARADTDTSAADKGFRRTVPGLDELARRLTRFKRSADTKAPAKPPEPEAPAAAEPAVDPDDASFAAAATADAQGAAVAADAQSAVAAADAGPAAAEPAGAEEASPSRDAPPRPAQPEGRTAERAETARVDAALLDALLNSAGEINIFQSRLSQQLHSIDFHLGELGQTVTRLREQLRKLEAETEAQILYRHQDDLTAGGQGFDPLELDRYSTIQQLSRALAETANDVASINELLQGLANEAETLLSQQARVTSELQEGLMQTRMVPFQRHSSRLARIVRQAASDTNKLAELVVHGGGSEVDRQVLDTMLAPFEHLLRNAVVHGIEPPAERRNAGKPETGRVELSLRREGSEVLIEVADDGRGLDLDAIRRKAIEQGLISDKQKISDDEAVELILRPGFSTAHELTQAAGRGVGMDVVDNEIKKLGGSMRIESVQGRGTRFYIRLPYTLAVTHALIVDAGEETFALPLPTIEGVTRVPRETLLDLLTHDEPKLEYGGVSYRIQHLGSLVGGMPSALPAEEGAVSLVLVRAGEHSTALLTDALEGSREIVVKTLGPHLGSVAGVSGATILGDGRVIVILDVGTLVRAQHGAAKVPVHAAPAARPPTALVVDDSITMRRVTQRLLERRGVRVITARDGLDAITALQEHEAPDIILLDIEMPRMDGYQFASHVRNDEKLKDVPIVMITSRSGEKHRAKAIELGVNDYLSKPYQEAQLIASVEALLGRTL